LIKGDSENEINKEIIYKIEQTHAIYLVGKQDHSIIKNLYRDIFQTNYYRSQPAIKKLYTIPEKIKIPAAAKKDKIKIDFIKATSNCSLYVFNRNSIYLTGKITEKIPLLKNYTLRISEYDHENNENISGSSNKNGKDNRKIDILYSINNDVKYLEGNNLKEEHNKDSSNILNLYNFVFILNDENFVILYEPQIHDSNNPNKSIEKSSVISELELNSKYPSSCKSLEIELVPMFETGNEANNCFTLPHERVTIGLESVKEDISSDDLSNNNSSIHETTDAQKSIPNSTYDIKIQNNFIQYGTNNLKMKLTYNSENENKSLFEDKTGNISSNFITDGNIGEAGSYYNDNSLNDEEYPKELLTENANNDEIFKNTFSFEQTIEELRNYINLVGISLLE